MLPGETVVVLTAGTTSDPYSGESVADWTTPTEVAVPDVLCEPRPGGEPQQDARNQITSGWTLYFQSPPDVAIDPTNRIRVRGVVYDILGEPADWRLGSWQPGLVVQCERSVG
jgi:hypothetical protein